MKRRILVCATIATIAAVYCRPALGDPVITFSPDAKTGANNPVTFTAPTGGSDYTWDLNGDGVYGDRVGDSVRWTYDLPGTIMIGLRYTDASAVPQQAVEPLVVSGLEANFVVFPSTPAPGEQVTFAYSPGPALPSPPEWDLNGDGIFPDATGARSTRTFPAPGVYLVGLRVTDIDDAVTTAYEAVTVATPVAPGGRAKPQLRLMSPFPVVRISGKVSARGARIKHLTIRAPYGSTVMIRCRGRGCPFRRTNQTLALAGAKTPSKTIRVKRLERRLLRGGTTLKILISGQGEIGKYTKFKIVTHRAPVRSDLCLMPGSTSPVECPSS